MKEALYCKNNLKEPVPYKDLCLTHTLRAMDNPTNQAVVGIVVVIVIIVLAVVALRIFKWHLLTKQFFSKYKPANPATTVFKYDNFSYKHYATSFVNISFLGDLKLFLSTIPWKWPKYKMWQKSTRI